MTTLMNAIMLVQVHSGRVRGIRDSFGGSSSAGGSGTMLLLLLSAAAALLLAFVWLKSRRGGRPLHSAMKLFREAIASLGLNGEEKSILERMVRELRVQQPAQLLLDAGAFDRLSDKYVARTPQAKRPHLTECLRSIRRKAFS